MHDHPYTPREQRPAGHQLSRHHRQRRRRRGSRQRFGFRLQNALFVLPNLFTVSSIYCGIYAIAIATGTSHPAPLYQASLAVFFGFFFDMADGRVARLTHTQSLFGVQLDSLADLVTFGVAPALIAYRWALAPLGMLGVLTAGTFVACSALRLARFNVLALRTPEGGPSAYFVGLPTPTSAGVVVSAVMYHQRAFGGLADFGGTVAIGMLCIGGLMVSNVRYPTFKNVHLRGKGLIGPALGMIVFAVLAIVWTPTLALASMVMGYVVIGLIDNMLRSVLGNGSHTAQNK